MSYRGLTAYIPVGQGGLLTDESPTLIGADKLYRANNVSISSGVVTNDYGTLRWNYGRFQANFTASSITNLITSSNHGLINGTPITVSSTGTLPSPLLNTAVYYVVNATTHTFQLSVNGANNTVASGGYSAVGLITLLSNGSGTHTLVASIPTPLTSASITTTFSSSIATASSHGMKDGQYFYFSTTGVLPSPLVCNQQYLAINCTQNTFQVSIDGLTPLTLSGGSGTQTLNVVDGVVAIHDYWPLPGIQYIIVVTRSGRVYRFSDSREKVEITASGGAPTRLSVIERVHLLECGQEQAGRPKKLFIFTGGSPIQVISGTSMVRTNISNPAADWGTGSSSVGNYPVFGIVYLNRVFAFGNQNFPHFVYASSNTDNEDFRSTFNSTFFNVYPGDGDRLIHAFNYKGRLHLLKYPRGLYGIGTQDISDPLTWYFSKLNEDIGTTSIHGSTPVFDDVWMTTADGSISSLSAAFKLGNLDTANILRELQVIEYIKEITSPLGIGERQALWHPTKKKALFLFRRAQSKNNSILLSFNLTLSNPILTTVDKDQVNCMALIRGVDYNDQLFYGSEDGFIYQAERENRIKDPFVQTTSAYTSTFQTPHINFTQNNVMTQSVSQGDKNFDFLEVEYIPTTATNLTADIYLDGVYSETKSFYLGKGSQLGVMKTGLSPLQGKSVRNQRLQIHGRGRTISIKLSYTTQNAPTYDGSNRGQNLGLPIKITGLRVYYRLQSVSEKA